jgi:hypothetical protein
MADSTANKTGLNALTAENWSNVVQDSLFDAMPSMQMHFSRLGTKKGGSVGLGIPDASHLLTGVSKTKTKRKEVFARSYQPLIHNALPSESDGKVMQYRDSMPVRSNWQAASPAIRFQRPTVKWCEITDPMEVPNSDLRDTKRAAAGERNGWEAIGDLMKVERNDVLGVHCRRWNQILWGTYTGTKASTTGYPTDETADQWDAIHSYAAVAAESGLYCGVDRDIATGYHMRGHTISAATAPVFRDMIRWAQREMTIYNADGTTSKGLFSKGANLPVILTSGSLFNVALAEAESIKGAQVIPAGTKIANLAEFGFSGEVVRIDNTYIVADPACPDNDAVGVNFDWWTTAIHPDGNFYQSPPFNQNQIKGGDDSHAWFLRTRILEVCENPQLGIVYWNNLG